MDIVWLAVIALLFLLMLGLTAGCDRLNAAEVIVSAIYVIGTVAAVLLFVYLLYALVKAEDCR